LIRLLEAERAAEGAYAANGDRARAADTRRWATWCAERGVCPLPATPEDVAAYLREHRGTRAPATVARWASTIAFRHRQAALPDPTKSEVVRLALRAIRRAPAVVARELGADASRGEHVGGQGNAAGRPAGQRQALALRARTARRRRAAASGRPARHRHAARRP
jgi:hypothetical protein